MAIFVKRKLRSFGIVFPGAVLGASSEQAQNQEENCHVEGHVVK